MKTKNFKTVRRFALVVLGLLAVSPLAAFAATTIGTNLSTTGNLVVNGSVQFTTGAGAGYILQSDGTGNASWLDASAWDHNAANDLTTATVFGGNVSGTYNSIAVNDLTIAGQTVGDILYFNGVNWTRLAVGANGQVLTLAVGLPSWAAVSYTETDPIFGASAAAGIGAGDITNWNTAFGWGNHALAGYLTSESDPLAVLKATFTTNGDLLTGTGAGTYARLGVGTNGQVLTVSGGVPTWQNAAVGFADPMTTRGDIIIRNAANTTARLGVGTVGQVLKSDGTDISWGAEAAETDPIWVAAEPNYGNLGQAETITGNWVNTANPWADNEVAALAAGVQGNVLYHDGTSWTALAPGVAGQYLQTQGAGADPQWAAVPAVPSGTTTDSILRWSGAAWVEDTNVLATAAGNLTANGDLDVLGNTTLGDATGDTLTFNASTLSVPNDLNIDSDTLYIDATNNRIGVGTAAPQQKLDIEKGHIRLGQVIAPSAPTVAVGGAGVLTGNYHYNISFVTALGETEGGNNSGLVSPSNQQVILSNIPVSSDNAVIARKIYRTTAGGLSVLKKLVATISDNTTTIYTDNIADGSLGVSEPTVNSTGGLIFNGTDRVVIIGNKATAVGVKALAVDTGYGNSAVGRQALYHNTIGYFNSALGETALALNTEGYRNTAFGNGALYANTAGYQNSATGNVALYSNTTGYDNTAVGVQALYSNTTGYNNVAMGMHAGHYLANGSTANQTSNNSLFLGYDTRAGAALDTNEIVIGASTIGVGSNSVVLGNDSITKTILKGNVGIGTTGPAQKLDVAGKIALDGTTVVYRPTTMTDTLVLGDGGTNLLHTAGSDGYYNTFVGIGVGAANTTGYKNAAIGADAFKFNTTGYYNTALGVNALISNTTGYANTANGADALLSNTTGYNNTGFGAATLFYNTTGIGNSASGNNSLSTNTSGNYNSALGNAALNQNTTGNDNTAAGYKSLRNNTTGSFNTSVGDSALFTNTTGSYNTANGTNAGRFIADGITANTTSSNSVYEGYDTRALVNGDTNEIVIGASAIGNGSNTVTLGNTSITKTILRGNVSIGTTSPDFLLDVAGNLRLESANRLYFGGTGALDTLGNLYHDGMEFLFSDVVKAAGYKSSDGSAGLTATITVRASGGLADCTLTVKNGLITATTCP